MKSENLLIISAVSGMSLFIIGRVGGTLDVLQIVVALVLVICGFGSLGIFFRREILPKMKQVKNND